MKTVYAIPNCNTVKKALDWLKANKVAVEFHDYKKKGITEEKLQDWLKTPNDAFENKTPFDLIISGETKLLEQMIYHLNGSDPS